MEAVKRFLNDERGLETVEYAIILALITGLSITVVMALGGWVRDQFTATTNELSTATTVPVP